MATPLSKKAKVSPEESRPLAAGTRVVLRGLKGSSEHNGTYALVRSYDESRSRYCVALEAGKGSEVSVKPQCVHELDAGEGTHLRHKVLAHEHVRELLGVNLEEGAVQWYGGDRQRIKIKHSCTSAGCAYTRTHQSQYIDVIESDENGVFDVGKYLTLAVRKLLQKHNQCFPSLTFDALMAAPSEQQLATQMQDKKHREDVIAKENDKAKILRLEKELKALRKQKAMWEEKSVRKLTEDPPESEQETVTVNVFSSDVKVKNPNFKKFKKTAENDHKRKWLHDEVTGVLAAVRFNADGSADRAAYILNKAIKELFKGDLAHHIQDVIGGFEVKMTPEKLIVDNISKICADLKTIKTEAARFQRDVLLTTTVGAAAAQSASGGTMFNAVCALMGVQRKGAPAARAKDTYANYVATLKPFTDFKGIDKYSKLTVGQKVLCHNVPATLQQLADEVKNVPCIVAVESGGVTRTLEFKNYGDGEKGARLRLPSPSLVTRIDMSRPFDAEAKAAIDEFYKQVLTISPCTKDICRLRVGRWLYAEMPMAIMHDSYKNLYKKFTDKHPQFALVVSKTTFKKNAPFFLRKVKRQSCLCETCENSAMLLKTLKKAADDIEKLFKERVILESANGPVEVLSDDDDDSNTEELWGRVEGRMAELEKIVKLCNSEHKLDLMKLFLCAERTPECIAGTCDNCGIHRVWSDKLRKDLVHVDESNDSESDDGDGAQQLRSDLPKNVAKVFTKKYPTELYMKGTESSAEPDEDPDAPFGASATSTRRKTTTSQEDLMWLLDYTQTFFPTIAAHRETLLRSKESAMELFRNALPGWLLNDVDWAENFTIVKARMLQSEYWAQIQASLLIGIVRWLDKKVFDDIVTPLQKGDDVTVIGFVGDHGVVRIGKYNGGTHEQSQPLEKGDILGYKIDGDVVPVIVKELEELMETDSLHEDKAPTYTVMDGDGNEHIGVNRTQLFERATYFATVQAKCGDEYDVTEPDGKVHRVPRSALHKRVWISEAYSCFSNDKHHDTWQTQHFMNEMLKDWHKTHGKAFLDAEIYESNAIELQSGDVVTVQPTGTVDEAEAEFDATVVAVGRGNIVELRVDGREGTAFCDRSLLRKHQLKIVYVVHSDNAAQHFHSVKAMYWLSHLPSTFGWIDRVYWAFGCPGHGKGPWDGIGALIKTMLRHSITTGHDIEADGLRIMTPEDCANHMRGQLGEEWAKEQRRKRAVISRMTVFYADEDVILRRKDAEYSKIPGVSKGRGFMRIGAGAVAMRPHSCFCRACILADGGKACSGMSNNLVVYDCVRGSGTREEGFCKWSGHNITESRVDKRITRQQCEEAGRKLSEDPKNLKPGTFVIVQNGDTRGGADAWWLAVVVDAFLNSHHFHMRQPVGLESGTGLFKTCTVEKEKLPSGQWIARGDRVIAVRWCERVDVAQDRERLTFVDDDWTTPELLNSAAIVKFVVWNPKQKTKKEIERKLVVRQVQPGSNARGTRSAPVEPPRTVTTWKVAESAERAALDAMHDDVVGA